MYTRFNRPANPILATLINLLAIAAAVGFMITIVALFSGTSDDSTQIVVYMIWFAVALLSAYAMHIGDVWGAYALGIATVGVTLYDFVQGSATIGGATLGLAVMFIVVDYITSHQPLETAHERETAS